MAYSQRCIEHCAYNKETGQVEVHPILDTLSHVDPQIVLLTVDGETLETTAEHPFYEMDSAPWLALGELQGRWTDAGDLEVGDRVWQVDGTTGVVEAVETVAVEQRMYNLTVDVAHTFFVGEGRWLVHNCGPGLNITNSQFGRKIGKHAQDYGLDPRDAASRDWLRGHIEDIGNNFDTLRQGAWNPHGGGGTDYFFFQKGNDVVVANADGTFVTILKDGITNEWVQNASLVTSGGQ